jgi:2-methylcitrate dehydratase PrpD
MTEETELDRRTVLQGAGGLAAASTLAGALSEAAAASDVDGRAATEVPEAARTVEGGLSLFTAKWNAVGGVITNTQQFGAYLSGKTFNLHVADDGRAYRLELGPEGGASYSPGADPRAHASLTVDEADWHDILYGEYTGLAPALEGRAFAPRSNVNEGALLAIILSVIAHIPVSTAQDLGANAKLLRGILRRRGETDCGSTVGDSQVETADERLKRTATGAPNRAPDVTCELATRAAALSYEDLPEEVVERVKTQLKSILGVSYAATTLEPARKLVDGMAEVADGSGATAIAGDDTFRTSPSEAAFVNAYLAQMLEWEDFTYMAHTGAMIVPTAIAAAEAAGASGKELITAVALGNEIAGRVGAFLTDPTNLGQALPVHLSELPFVAGKLFGLDADALRDASGLAGAQPQTTAIATWPAEGKGFIGAEPARASVRAARLADTGLHGKRDHLENAGGYWYRVADVLDPRHLAAAYDGLGEEFFLASEYFNKRYPCDGFTQTAVHATLDVREQLVEAGVDPTDPAAIDAVEVGMNSAKTATGSLFGAGTYDGTVGRVLDADRPDWTYTALLFDGTYPLAAALLDGELTHRQYRPERIADDRIETLFGRFEQATDLSVGQFGAEVTAVVDGDTFEARLGEREYQSFVPCIQDDVMDGWTGSRKLERAATDVIGSRRVARLDDAIETLESVGDVRALTARL